MVSTNEKRELSSRKTSCLSGKSNVLHRTIIHTSFAWTICLSISQYQVGLLKHVSKTGLNAYIPFCVQEMSNCVVRGKPHDIQAVLVTLAPVSFCLSQGHPSRNVCFAVRQDRAMAIRHLDTLGVSNISDSLYIWVPRGLPTTATQI